MSYVLVPLPGSHEAKKKINCLQLLRNLMAKLLRKIKYKTNWDPNGEFAAFLDPGEAPADALQDLKTTDNALSAFGRSMTASRIWNAY